MNKLFTKIAAFSVGLAMAVGVGVAIASNKEAVSVHADTAITDFDEVATSTGLVSGQYLLMGGASNGKVALPLNPSISSGKIAGTPISQVPVSGEGYLWTLEKVGNYWSLSDGTNYLYHANGGNSGTNLDKGTTASYYWDISSDANGLIFAGVNNNVVKNRGMLLSGTNFGGYALSNKDSSGYYRVNLYTPKSTGHTHDWGEWTQTTAPSCTTPGEETRSCSGCDAVETRPVAAIGHDWVAGTVHAPTCTEPGYTEYECSRCHEEKHDDEVAATGHNYVDHVCSICGAKEPDEETAYLDSFDSISGYVDEDHFISYEAAQGEASTAPAVNNSEIRIYQNGGLLTITGNDGAKIKSITIGSSMVTSVSIEVDGDSSGDEDIAAGDTLTVSDLNADEVVFTCTGADKNHRLYLNYLSVTFEAPVVTKYTITYHANANDEETGSMSPTVGTNPQVAECGFEREGYTFAAWNTQTDGEGTDYEVGTPVSEDLDLYAIWQEYIAPIGADVTMEGNDNSSSAIVVVSGSNKPAIKCGTGSKQGGMKLTLNASGISKVKIYIGAWNGNSENTTVNIAMTGGGSVSPSTLNLTKDGGFHDNSPFTLSGSESIYKHILTLTDAQKDAVITITAEQASNNRFIAWGATNLLAETFADEFIANTSCNVEGTSAPTFNNDSSWLKLEASFNSLDDEEKGFLRSAEYTKTGTGSSTVVTPKTGTSQKLADAMAKYDYIESKYNPTGSASSPWKNFIGRAITPINGSLVMPGANIDGANAATTITIVVSMISLTTIAGYAILRKRKIK